MSREEGGGGKGKRERRAGAERRKTRRGTVRGGGSKRIIYQLFGEHVFLNVGWQATVATNILSTCHKHTSNHSMKGILARFTY